MFQYHQMSNLKPRYPALGLKVVVKILELADILEITPKQAAELYLESQAEKSNTRKATA